MDSKVAFLYVESKSVGFAVILGDTRIDHICKAEFFLYPITCVYSLSIVLFASYSLQQQ